MSKRKTKHNEPPPAPRRTSASVWLLLLICIATAGLISYRSRLAAPPSPEQLLGDGMQHFTSAPDRSEKLLETAIAAAGGWGHYPDAEVALSCLLARRGAWSEAAFILRKLDTSTCRADLLVELGRHALESGQTEFAIETLKVASHRPLPERARALELLSQAHHRLGQATASLEAARELVAAEPDVLKHRLMFIQQLKDAERGEECCQAIREALQQSDGSSEVMQQLRYLLIEELVALGELEAAREELTSLAHVAGDSPRLQVVAADLNRLDGQLEAALETINRVLSRAPEQPLAHFTRGVVLLDLGRYEAAIPDLQEAIRVAPLDERARFKLAEAYRATGDAEAALEHQRAGAALRERRTQLESLERELASRPTDADLLGEIAGLHRALGQDQQAEQYDTWARQLQDRPHP